MLKSSGTYNTLPDDMPGSFFFQKDRRKKVPFIPNILDAVLFAVTMFLSDKNALCISAVIAIIITIADTQSFLAAILPSSQISSKLFHQSLLTSIISDFSGVSDLCPILR